MVDESRFRYRRDAGSNDAGARGAPPRDPRLEPGRDPGQRPPAAAPRPQPGTAEGRPAAAPQRAPAAPRPAPQQGRAPAAPQGRAPAPQPAGRAAASQGGDPLAELARLIAEQDPFADFGDLPPQTAPEPAPRAAAPGAAPAARPFDPRRDLRAPARAPEPDDDDTFDEPPPRRAAVPRAAAPEPAARQPQPQRRAPEPPAPRAAAEAAAPRAAAAPARPQPPAFLTHPAAGAGQPQPGARAPQEPVRRQAALNPPPARPALVPPRSDAAPVDRSATSVRLGYGSLAHQAQVPPAQPAPARSGDVARGQDPRLQDQQRAPEAPRAAQRPAAPQYEDDDDFYEEAPRRAPAPEARPQPEPRSATYAYSAERRQNEEYDEYDEAYDPQYDEDGYMPPHGEEVYEGETHRRKGRAALLLAASVLGLIVAGTAGVFAYRMAIHGTVTGSAGGPPVIRADTSPSKIVTPPAPATADSQQKMIYDRIGSAGNSNERMVPREEQPVDVTTAAIRSGTPAATDPVISSLATEPKRVRTVPIRADAGSPDSAAAAGPSGAAASGPSSGVTALAAYAAGQAPGAAPSVVSLPSAKAPPQVSRTGEFVVQVASQRSEADAMGSWKALQTRYPNLLSSYVATVKKADLGDRGIYYRAQVGPFATKDQANDLCQALRAQGGDCLVSKN